MQEYKSESVEEPASESSKELPMPKRVSVMLSLDHYAAKEKLEVKRKKARKVSRASRKRNKTAKK